MPAGRLASLIVLGKEKASKTDNQKFQMKKTLRVGASFGLTSGAITTMGLIVGLYEGTHSLKAVVGGVLTIAVADAFSDALGMHIHEESENEHTIKEIWESTIATFISKFVFTVSFLVPVLLFDLNTSVTVSVVWGLTLVAIISYFIARDQRAPVYKIVGEHVSIAVIVIIVTHWIGYRIYSLVNF